MIFIAREYGCISGELLRFNFSSIFLSQATFSHLTVFDKGSGPVLQSNSIIILNLFTHDLKVGYVKVIDDREFS